MNKERTKEIRKAISLLGWIEISERIRNPEDRAIYNELIEEFRTSHKASADRTLEKHKIKF